MSQLVNQAGENGHSSPTSGFPVARLTLACILIVGSWLLMGPIWVASLRHAPNEIIDFYQDWGSACNYRVGMPVYSPLSISIPHHLNIHSYVDLGIEYNAHPPASVLMVLPFAHLKYANAILLWNMISLAGFLISIAIIVRVLTIPAIHVVIALAIIPYSTAIFGNFQLGQLNLALVVLITAAWAFDRADRSHIGGFLLGTAAAIKLFPAYLAICYLACGRVRFVRSTVIGFVCLNVVAALVFGWGTYWDYVNIVLPSQAKFQGAGDNLSIAGFWHKLWESTRERSMFAQLATNRSVIQWGIHSSNFAITMIVVMLALKARTIIERDLVVAAAITAMLLVSPVTWQVNLVFLMLPFGLLTTQTWRLGPIAATLFLVLPITLFPQRLLAELALGASYVPGLHEGSLLGVRSVKFYAVCVTFLLLIAAFRVEVASRVRTITN